MGREKKLLFGIIILVAGIVITYEAYVNTFKDIILFFGILIIIVGIANIISYYDSRVSLMIKESVGEYVKGVNKPNFSFTNEQPLPNRPLKIRRDFNNYDDDYVEEESSVIESEPMGYNTRMVLQTRNLDDETVNFGNNLNFTPNYDRPLKINRTPKKREKSFFDEEEYFSESTVDKSENIKKALQEDYAEPIKLNTPKQKVSRDIKIDINDPEALPIPKLLNSFILVGDELITSNDAFDQLSNTISKEVMLEIPSLNDLSDRFLSHIPTIYSRVIIEDFDVSNISYMILVASLLKQGVHIKTMPMVNTINLVTDDSYALILSKGRKNNNIEYGAVYDDKNVLSEIRSTFEKTWEMAKELDENIILKYMEAGAA